MSAQKTPKFCWGCGKPLKPGQKFCTYCGKPVKFEKRTPLSRSTVNKQIPVTPKTASFNPTLAANLYGRAPSEDLSTKYHQIIQNPMKNNQKQSELDIYKNRYTESTQKFTFICRKKFR